MIPLSICIPTFERPELLERALSSITSDRTAAMNQIEIIVSDDSRDDRSAAVIAGLLASWPGNARHVANRPGLGMVNNFNQCVRLAAGRYIHILHDDDYLVPGGGAAILRAIAHGPENPVLLFGVEVVDGSGHLRRRQEFPDQRHLSAEVALKNVLSNSSYVRFPAIVVAADAYKDVGLFDPVLGGATDLDMWIRLFARYGVTCIPETVSAYSIHSEAHTSGMFNADTVAILATIFERVLARGSVREDVLRGYEADFLAQFILGGAYRQLRVGDRNKARSIMKLFDLPAIRTLGRSRRWWPVRLAMSALVSAPLPLVSQTARWLERVSPDTSILWPR